MLWTGHCRQVLEAKLDKHDCTLALEPYRRDRQVLFKLAYHNFFLHKLLRHFGKQRLHAYYLEEARNFAKDNPAYQHRNSLVTDLRRTRGRKLRCASRTNSSS